MKKNTITMNDLASMIQSLQADSAKAYESLNERITALEKGAQKSATAKKPVTQKSKTSAPTTTAKASAPKWVLDKKCVYSAPNEWTSKKARYAFKMQAEEMGGIALTDDERNALVKKVGDKYITVRKFKTEKDAKAFFTKWNQQ